MAPDIDGALGQIDAALAGVGLPQAAPALPAMTYGELAAFVAEHRLEPPTRLVCHPSVVNALRDTEPEPDWPPRVPPPNLPQIDIFLNHDMAAGAWELYRGDELIDQGVIA